MATLTKLVQAVHLRNDGREPVGIRLRHLVPLICGHRSITDNPSNGQIKPQPNAQSGNEALGGGKALPLMRFFTARYRDRSFRRTLRPCTTLTLRRRP
jgi:hypothetical protein